jgi:hypothetical protein
MAGQRPPSVQPDWKAKENRPERAISCLPPFSPVTPSQMQEIKHLTRHTTRYKPSLKAVTTALIGRISREDIRTTDGHGWTRMGQEF